MKLKAQGPTHQLIQDLAAVQLVEYVCNKCSTYLSNHLKEPKLVWQWGDVKFSWTSMFLMCFQWVLICPICSDQIVNGAWHSQFAPQVVPNSTTVYLNPLPKALLLQPTQIDQRETLEYIYLRSVHNLIGCFCDEPIKEAHHHTTQLNFRCPYN